MLNGATYWLVAVTYLQTAVTPCRKSDIPLPVASCAAGSLGQGWLSNWCPLTPLHWDAPAWQVLAAGGDVLGGKKSLIWENARVQHFRKTSLKVFSESKLRGSFIRYKEQQWKESMWACHELPGNVASVMLWKQTELLYCMSRVPASWSDGIQANFICFTEYDACNMLNR